MAIADIIDKAKKDSAERYTKTEPEEMVAEDAIDPGEGDEGEAVEPDMEEVTPEAPAEDAPDEPTESPEMVALMDALEAEREKTRSLEAELEAWKASREPIGDDTLNHQDAILAEIYGDDYGKALEHFHELMAGDDGTELEGLRGSRYPGVYAFKKGKDRMTAKEAEAEAAKQAEREAMRAELMAEMAASKEKPVKKVIPSPAPTIPQGYPKAAPEPEKKQSVFSVVDSAKAKRKGA